MVGIRMSRSDQSNLRKHKNAIFMVSSDCRFVGMSLLRSVLLNMMSNAGLKISKNVQLYPNAKPFMIINAAPVTGQFVRMMVMVVKDMEVARVRAVQLAVSVVERARAVSVVVRAA